jgi:hypothetical protein
VHGQLPAEVELRDLGAHQLKDLAEPERVFQLLHPDLPDNFPPLSTPPRFRLLPRRFSDISVGSVGAE